MWRCAAQPSATKPCLCTALLLSLQSLPSTEAQQGCDLVACIGTSAVHRGPVSGIPALETCGAYTMCSVIGSRASACLFCGYCDLVGLFLGLLLDKADHLVYLPLYLRLVHRIRAALVPAPLLLASSPARCSVGSSQRGLR